MLATLSEGRPGRAIRWVSTPDLFERRSEALDQLREAMKSDIGGRFALAERIVGRGKLVIQRRRVRSALEAWLSIWRDLLYRGYQVDVISRNLDQLPSFESLAQTVAPADRYEVVIAISSTLAAVDSNANLRLAMESLMLELPAV